MCIISFKSVNAFHLFIYFWFGITYTNMHVHVNAHTLLYS